MSYYWGQDIMSEAIVRGVGCWKIFGAASDDMNAPLSSDLPQNWHIVIGIKDETNN